MSWWNERAGRLQDGVRRDERENAALIPDRYDARDARRAIVHTREDVVKRHRGPAWSRRPGTAGSRDRIVEQPPGACMACADRAAKGRGARHVAIQRQTGKGKPTIGAGRRASCPKGTDPLAARSGRVAVAWRRRLRTK
jgi:hypothetical protein